MKRQAIITIDVGTTYCKALVWDANGVTLAQAKRMNQPIYPRAGWAEQTPRLWWDNARKTAKAALREASSTHEKLHIAALGLTSCRDIVIPVDRHGEPLGNAILWMDTRARLEALEIGEKLGAQVLHRKTGMIPGPTVPACKILWLKRNHPEQIEKCAHFLQPRDYVFYRLTGELLTDYSMASRTMMFDQEAKTWWTPVFDLLGIKTSQFPEVAEAMSFRLLHPEVARKIGLPPRTPVVLGGGDRQCEALGALVSERWAMDSTGTGTNISMSGPRGSARYHPKVDRSIHVVPERSLMEVTINTSGLALEYFRGLFGGDETYFKCIERKAAQVPPGSNGLIVLPFFMGARSVRWNPEAASVLFGLTFAHQDKEIIRALMEGIAFEEKTALEVFRQMGFAPEEIRALGGGSRNRLWNQIKADVTGIRLVTLNVSDVASFGAMALASVAVGLQPDPETAVSQLSRVEDRYTADPAATERYQKIFSLYSDLYKSNEAMFARLEELRQD
jgi:xylulokinase